MARSFNGSSHKVEAAASGLGAGTLTTFTFGCWLRPASAANGTALGIGDSNSDHYIALGANASNVVFIEVSAGGGASNATGGTLTSGVWNHIAGVQSSDTNRVAYLNGAGGSANTVSRSPSGLDRTTIGALVINGSTFSWRNGEIAEAGIWDVALDAAELAALAKGVSPLLVRPGSLVFYAPVLGNASPEHDLVGGLGLTVTGATKAEVHPAVLRPMGQTVAPTPAAAGGTTFTQAVAGASTPTGTAARRTARMTTSLAAPTGAPTRQTQRTASGAANPAGALVRALTRTLTGALTSSGSLTAVRTLLLTVAGTLTSSGAAGRRTARTAAGTSAPAGAITKQAARIAGGAVSPSGATSSIRTLLLTLAGTLTSGASLVRRTGQASTGATAPAGALVRQPRRTSIGAVSPAGAASAIRTVLLTFAGTLTSSGALARLTRRGLAGALTPAGALARRLARALTGVVVPAGAMSTDASVPAGRPGVMAPVDRAGPGMSPSSPTSPGMSPSTRATATMRGGD